MFKQKLKGYTLMELMVTLLISSIVILITTQIYLNFDRLVRNKAIKMNKSIAMFEFYQTFSYDFENAYTIEFSDPEVYLNGEDKKVIRYVFDPKFVVRYVGEHADTFRIAISKLDVQKDPIIGRIDQLFMDIQNDDAFYAVRLIKKYSNDLFMNATNIK